MNVSDNAAFNGLWHAVAYILANIALVLELSTQCLLVLTIGLATGIDLKIAAEHDLKRRLSPTC